MSDKRWPRRLQRNVNDGQAWSIADQELARDWTGSAYELAKRLGRSEQAIATKRHDIKLFGVREGHATGRHDSGIRRKHGDPCPGCQLALPLTGVCDDCG